MNNKISSRAAFTLVEVLVTTAIIGILIGLVLGVSGVASRKSDEGKAKAQMQMISNALEEYRVLFGSYPAGLGDLMAVTNQLPIEFLVTTNDPWGRGYVYERPSRYAFNLKSLGIKNSGADRDSDDIISGTY
jgi:general secretion pathway protein G